jgi:hypothetical protein
MIVTRGEFAIERSKTMGAIWKSESWDMEIDPARTPAAKNVAKDVSLTGEKERIGM